MQKGEKARPVFYLHDIEAAIIDIHSETHPNGPQMQPNSVLMRYLREAHISGFTKEGSGDLIRSGVIFPDYVGVVFDEFAEKLKANGDSGNEFKIDDLALWKAEERVFGLSHDPIAFRKRQEQLQAPALTPEVSSSS